MSEQPPPRRGPRLENRLPAEGINSSTEHPLREFTWLIGASLAVLLLVVAVVGWGARWLAPKLPFSTEVALAERLLDHPQKPEDAAISAALQSVADRVAARMGLPDGMGVVVQFEHAPTVNAYASLGGRIRVHQGLLARLRSEDEIASLLAHEIAHVKHRHVASSMGRGLALALLLGFFSADAGASAAQSTLGQATGLAMLGYSREQERQADDEALHAVVAAYGHAGGLVALFTNLRQTVPAGDEGIESLSTHPLTSSRLAAIQAAADQAGWPTQGALTPQAPVLAALRPAAPAVPRP